MLCFDLFVASPFLLDIINGKPMHEEKAKTDEDTNQQFFCNEMEIDLFKK